jgi:hypothetical protein
MYLFERLTPVFEAPFYRTLGRRWMGKNRMIETKWVGQELQVGRTDGKALIENDCAEIKARKPGVTVEDVLSRFGGAAARSLSTHSRRIGASGTRW